MSADPLLRAVRLDRDEIPDPSAFPFTLPAIRALDRLELHPEVTFLVGENGSGKSTLVEAIAAKLDLDHPARLSSATIYEIGERGLVPTAYADTEHYRVTRAFLEDPGAFLRHLFSAD